MEKLLLVDGSNLLFQMFYGMPARIVNAQGRPIQGTLGFVGALLKIIRMLCPTHVAVLFDGECSNPRKELDGHYKANRPDFSQIPEEDTPFSQLPDIYAALDYLGIRHAETADCEADDWIAGYAYLYGADTEVVIASQDSDFFQLISQHVQILCYRGDRSVLCDADWLRKKLGVAPCQYAAFKALTGDAADNIRGIPGVGPKTAASLLGQFGSLENLLENSQAISRVAIRTAVEQNAQRLRLNQLLIALSGSEQLPFSLEELRYCYDGSTSAQVLRAIGVR